jgi:hypothetical protein
MFPFLAFSCSCAFYPLLLGVPKDTFAPTPESLGIPGTLPANLTIFIAVTEPPLASLQQLSNWARAAEICESVGKALAFPALDSRAFNFLDEMRALYSAELKINTAAECICKVRHFRGGLITVRVPEAEIEAVRTLTHGLPQSMPYAFIGSTAELFRE